MSYNVGIARSAQRDFAGLPPHIQPRIFDAINSLGRDPRPPGCRKLTGRPGWRIRVGDYRVIYDIDDAAGVVTVIEIGHRGDIYR